MPASFFVVFATDRPGHGEVRAATREVHRAYLRRPQASGLNVVVAGPTFGDDGAMNGTLLILQADSKAAVERFVAADPYSQNDLFASVEIREWRCGLARPELLPLSAVTDPPPPSSP